MLHGGEGVSGLFISGSSWWAWWDLVLQACSSQRSSAGEEQRQRTKGSAWYSVSKDGTLQRGVHSWKLKVWRWISFQRQIVDSKWWWWGSCRVSMNLHSCVCDSVLWTGPRAENVNWSKLNLFLNKYPWQRSQISLDFHFYQTEKILGLLFPPALQNVFLQRQHEGKKMCSRWNMKLLECRYDIQLGFLIS